MKGRLPRQREAIGRYGRINSVIDYMYANYDIEAADADYQTAAAELARAQAVYKWLAGKSLPSLDNFLILSKILHTAIEDILVVDGDIRL